MHLLILYLVASLCGFAFADDFKKGNENCGIAGSAGGLVFGGEVADELQWPWLAALYIIEGNSYFCGGTLLSRRIVSTVNNFSVALHGRQNNMLPSMSFTFGIT